MCALVLCGACREAPHEKTAAVAGDPANRLVDEVRDGAARLAHSPSDTLVLSVPPHAVSGCPDGYRIEWRADTDRIPGLGVICTTGSKGFASIAYRQIVKVPRQLDITKKNGDPLTVALHKRSDGVIEVTAVQ